MAAGSECDFGPMITLPPCFFSCKMPDNFEKLPRKCSLFVALCYLKFPASTLQVLISSIYVSQQRLLLFSCPPNKLFFSQVLSDYIFCAIKCRPGHDVPVVRTDRNVFTDVHINQLSNTSTMNVKLNCSYLAGLGDSLDLVRVNNSSKISILHHVSWETERG